MTPDTEMVEFSLHHQARGNVLFLCWVLIKNFLKRIQMCHNRNPGIFEGSWWVWKSNFSRIFHSNSFHPVCKKKKKRQADVCMCSDDIYAPRVTSISQTLWACFKAQGIPWQGSRSVFRRNFSDFQKSALLDVNARAGRTRLAPATSFKNLGNLCLVCLNSEDFTRLKAKTPMKGWAAPERPHVQTQRYSTWGEHGGNMCDGDE